MKSLALRPVALLMGTALALPAAAILSVIPGPPPCNLTMTPVDVRGISYLAALSVSSGCPASQVFRVRKSSTLNTRRNGAPYQPIRPDGGPAAGGLFSWSVSRAGGNVPPGELWTSFTWEWQRYNPTIWNARLEQYGTWQRIPQREEP